MSGYGQRLSDPGSQRDQAAAAHPQGRSARDPRLSDQEQGPGAGPHQRPVGPRAAGQADGAGRVRLGRPFVDGVCDRGDPAHASVLRRRHRLARVQLRRPHHHRPRVRAGHPGVQLPPDHQGLPLGRRRLHRHQGQPRHHPGPGGRGLVAHRLHPHRGRVDLGRCGRPLLGRARAVPVAHGDRPRLHRDHRPRQPAWGQGVGQDLRRPDLPVHHLDVRHDHDRAGEGGARRRCTPSPRPIRRLSPRPAR